MFKDDSYIEINSRNIKQQMKEAMEAEEDIHYWIEEESDTVYFLQQLNFRRKRIVIAKLQSYYV
ncbi:MAG: hypothetical protein JJT76_07110 [Clostridiaceae bacterium]|nr:hypothetical protein [Clostridiaceae bacterium]